MTAISASHAVFVGFDHASGNAVAGIVHEHIETPEALHRRFDQALDGGGARDVNLNCKRLRTLAGACGGDGMGARRALVRNDELRTFLREQQTGCPTDAGAAARDNADLVIEAHGYSPAGAAFVTQRST